MESLLTVPWVLVVPRCEVVLKVSLQIGMLLSALSEEDIRKVMFLCINSSSCLLLDCQSIKRLSMSLLCHIFQQHLVLSGDSDSTCNINFRVELFVPLGVCDGLLSKQVERHLLFVHHGKRVLVFCLSEDRPLDQTIQAQWVI